MGDSEAARRTQIVTRVARIITRLNIGENDAVLRWR